VSIIGGNNRRKDQILLKGTCTAALETKHELEREAPWGQLVVSCAEDTTTLTGTESKLYEGENEQHKCTLFSFFTEEVSIPVTVSTPLAFAPWRGRGL